MRTSPGSKLPLTLLLASFSFVSSCAVADFTPPTPSAVLSPSNSASVEWASTPCRAAAASLIRLAGTEAFAAAQTAALEECDGKRDVLAFALKATTEANLALTADRQRDYCLATRGWRVWRSCRG